jgi:predicted RNA binding protein YcfA (HicA-like mRNA interferase family)
MPRLRRLNGSEVLHILEHFGFALARIKGSHHIMLRTSEGHELAILTSRSIYRSACRYIDETELRTHFYTD